jgi:hypothetical protein
MQEMRWAAYTATPDHQLELTHARVGLPEYHDLTGRMVVYSGPGEAVELTYGKVRPSAILLCGVNDGTRTPFIHPCVELV